MSHLHYACCKRMFVLARLGADKRGGVVVIRSLLLVTVGFRRLPAVSAIFLASQQST